ncbi:hypothetical protein BDZ89DRAFT_1143746 [Hymenopellis radicata]|nr:hypothetical protein BDZ89DRAFT_1143746 [Hymenopellis radicata]
MSTARIHLAEEKPYTRVPDYQVLYRAYRDNYAEFVGKDFHSLTSQQQKHWIDLGGELIKAADAARDKAYKAGESVANVSFELPRPDRSLELGDTAPTRRAQGEENRERDPSLMTARSLACSPAPVIPPPAAAVFTPPIQCQPQNPVQLFTIAAPQPVVVPMDYYQYNDPTCPIPEGDLPGPRSATLLGEWIAHQKAAKANEEEAARQTARAAQVKVVEVVKRQEDDVRAVKARRPWILTGVK